MALACLLGLMLLAGCASLLLGWSWISPGRVWQSFNDFDGSYDHTVIRESRLPRTLVAAAVGAALGLAGAVMQALTRNPLADPGLLGVNAGAGFAVTLALFVLGSMSMSRFIWFSLAGAAIATVVVQLIGSRGPDLDPLRMTLAGVAVGTVLTGVGSALTLLAPDRFYGARFWGVGSVADRTLGDLATVAPFLLVGLVVALLVARPLNALALGDLTARSLGVGVGSARVGAVVAVTLLAGAATAIVGMIAFVGLMMPHAVRWLVGPDQRWVFPMTAVASATLVMVCDTLGRYVLTLGEMPVSIVLACCGPPVLIALVRRESAAAL